MNMMDDLRYVSERDIKSFGSSGKRAAAWSKTGFIGKYLRTLDIAANVNGSVFVHGTYKFHKIVHQSWYQQVLG